MDFGSAPVDRITAWAVELPMRDRFTSVATSVDSRRLVIVRVDSGSVSGWGEAAPVPGHTDESLPDVWDSLEEALPAALAEGDIVAPGLAGAALMQACVDIQARIAGVTLAQYLGASNPVWASAAIGLGGDGNPDRGTVEEVAAAGYRHAKLKIAPDTNPATLAGLVSRYESLRFGLDANGSLGSVAPSFFAALDEQRFEYLEQPGPIGNLAWHSQLRSRMATPIALDESVATAEAIEQVMKHRAADIINIKPGRFGTTHSLSLARKAQAAGVNSRVGGLIESGVGRAHAVAVAGCDEFSVVGDLAASNRYFDNDLVSPQWRLADGRLVPHDRPGIGVEVDEDFLGRRAFWSLVAE